MSDSRNPSSRTQRILNLLNIPPYETQGLSNFERNEALKRFKDTHNFTKEKSQYVSTWLSNINQDLPILESEHLNSSTSDSLQEQTTEAFQKTTNKDIAAVSDLSNDAQTPPTRQNFSLLNTSPKAPTTISKEEYYTVIYNQGEYPVISFVKPPVIPNVEEYSDISVVAHPVISNVEEYSVISMIEQPLISNVEEYPVISSVEKSDNQSFSTSKTLGLLSQENDSVENDDLFNKLQINTSQLISKVKENPLTTSVLNSDTQGLFTLVRANIPSDFSDFSQSPSEYQPSTSYISDTESDLIHTPIKKSVELPITVDSKKRTSKPHRNRKKFRNQKSNSEPDKQKKNNKSSSKDNKAKDGKTASEPLLDESSESEEHVVVKSAKKNKTTGQRVRDKGHCCLFCDKIMINTARHYELVHKNETQVAKILIMPKGSAKRRNAFAELSRTADFYHNCRVLSEQEGELILVRRPSQTTSSNYSSYGPCPHCLGFMLKRKLWFHIRYHCTSAPTSDESSSKKRSVINDSNALLIGLTNTNYSFEYQESILGKFKNDSISEICKQDFTILKFGYLQFQKYGPPQGELIRQTMRQLGRFLTEVKSINSDIKELADCLLPSKFDVVISSVRRLCRTVNSKTNRPQFEVPSLALKLGHAFKKCLNIHRGMALRNGDLRKNELCISFLQLMEMEWSNKISSCALSTMSKRKFNHKELLPLTEDLLIVTKFLNQEIERLTNKLSLDVDYKTWRTLASCALARIILFNKKRSGEAAKMTMEQYATRPSFNEQGTQELFASLSPLEKNLASTMEVVDIEGKRGRRVPVIITPQIKSAIDLLIKTRSAVNISKNNPYIFAPAQSDTGHLRGHDCLKSICNEVNLEHPEYITGTKLRKYIATVSQIFNLGKNEADWLARHLGHDIRVHRNFYRLHENAVETTKISRLLIAIENGEANKYAGKSLDEINIEDLPGLEDESEEVTLPTGDEIDNSQDTSSDDEIPLANIKGKMSKNKEKRTISQIQEEPNLEKKQTQVKKRKVENQSAKTVKKTLWTTEEIKCVLAFFKFDLKKEFLPGKQKCEECKAKYPVLEKRKWTDIKFYLKNYYSRNKRLATSNKK